MKKYSYIGAFIALISFSACEQIVELDIDSAEPQLVINSQISNLDTTWEVQLSMSQGYFNQSDITLIEDALITISDNGGLVDTLDHLGDGLFSSVQNRSCEIGKLYTLTVNYKGETYTASETCFYQDTIDFIESYYLPESNGFIQEGYYVFQKSGEYEPEGDYYMWQIVKNDTNLRDEIGYQLDTDEFRETGYFNINIDPNDPLKYIDRGVFPRPFPYRFELGDEVEVYQLRISKGYFDFINAFSTQQSRSGTPFDPPPANPPFNIEGGALGYFSVVNVSSANLTVTE